MTDDNITEVMYKMYGAMRTDQTIRALRSAMRSIPGDSKWRKMNKHIYRKTIGVNRFCPLCNNRISGLLDDCSNGLNGFVRGTMKNVICGDKTIPGAVKVCANCGMNYQRREKQNET